MTPRGLRLVLTGFSRVQLEAMSMLPGRKLQRGVQADPTTLASSPLLHLRLVRSPRALLPCLRRVATLGPKRRGR